MEQVSCYSLTVAIISALPCLVIGQPKVHNGHSWSKTHYLAPPPIAMHPLQPWIFICENLGICAMGYASLCTFSICRNTSSSKGRISLVSYLPVDWWRAQGLNRYSSLVYWFLGLKIPPTHESDEEINCWLTIPGGPLKNVMETS